MACELDWFGNDGFPLSKAWKEGLVDVHVGMMSSLEEFVEFGGCLEECLDCGGCLEECC